MDPKLWLSKAREDLEVARVLLDKGYLDAAAFHAHQCAEKALKALYVSLRRTPPPKIHNLLHLAREVGVIELIRHDAVLLQGDYIAARYPVLPSPGYTREDVIAKIAAAERIFRVCSEKIL